MPKGIRWTEGQLAIVEQWAANYPDLDSGEITDRITDIGGLRGFTRGAIRQKVILARKALSESKPISGIPEDRPLLRMLKILWESRKMPDDKLKAQFVKAGLIVNGIYDEIAKAKAQIDKMRPAYNAQIAQDEARLQQEMDECEAAMREIKLADRELKR